MADPASTPALREAGGRRNASPDSVIYTADSNVSLSSSASASVDRSSFASDILDRDSFFSEISQHLAGHKNCGRLRLSGPVLDLPETNKATLLNSANTHLINKAVMAKGADQNLEDSIIPLHFDEEAPALDSARKSFSVALKDFQERKQRSDVLKKLERRRPASLDLQSSASNIASSSPRLAAMKKNMNSSSKSCNFHSPGTPANGEFNKGWSSERVPHHSSAARKQVGATTLPFSNGKTLPSKWEDAERWIFSPVSGDGVARPLYQQPQRRPQSKSGPVGPPGIAYYSLYSPAIVMYDRSNANNLVAASPFSTGVLMAENSSVRGGEKDNNFTRRGELCIGRSASVHGCTDLVCQSSGMSSQDEEVLEEQENTTAIVCSSVCRRDVATQMSPVNSSNSSPRRRSSFSVNNHSIVPITEVQSFNSSPPEVRDVQVDDRVTVSRWSKRNKSSTSSKGSGDIDNWKLRALAACSSPWDVSERSKGLAKANREEAKITAWENLQKAKAEAAIRKLEMKLEKKRSTSMDKIMNKLRSAQRKAQERRRSVLEIESNQVSKTFFLPLSLSRSRTKHIGSLSGCFTCHAF
ncbi:hypothetical protein V2J09_007152 [Rumex salicifolius]